MDVDNGKDSKKRGEQVLTRASKEYDFTVQQKHSRDLDAIVEKLNTTFQEELKDEVEAENFFLN